MEKKFCSVDLAPVYVGTPVKNGILKKLSNTLVRYIVGKLSINVANW